MSPSFHYSAELRDYSQLQQFIDEVISLSNALNYNSYILRVHSLYGVVIIPEACDPLWLCFTADGKTTNLKNFETADRVYSKIQVRTEEVGMETHITLIKLLYYLAARYFKNFTIREESVIPQIDYEDRWLNNSTIENFTRQHTGGVLGIN